MYAQQVFAYLLRSTVRLDDDWEMLRMALRARDIPGAELRASVVAAARRALRTMAYAHLRAVAEAAGQTTEFVCGAVDRLRIDGRVAEAYDALCAGMQASTDDEYVRALLDPLAALMAGPGFYAAREKLARIVAEEIRAAHHRAVAAAGRTLEAPLPKRVCDVRFAL